MPNDGDTFGRRRWAAIVEGRGGRGVAPIPIVGTVNIAQLDHDVTGTKAAFVYFRVLKLPFNYLCTGTKEEGLHRVQQYTIMLPPPERNGRFDCV